MNKVSIIGFGRFGAMLHALLSKGFEVDVFDKNPINNTEINEVSLEDAEEHDMMAARSQGLTHFVGRVIDDFGTNQTRIDTEGYKALHKLVNQTCNDSWELFEDIQNFNPYTEKMISELNGSFKKISEIIEK